MPLRRQDQPQPLPTPTLGGPVPATLSAGDIGDIPPPPIPPPPVANTTVVSPAGVAAQTPQAFAAPPQPRFGPGVPPPGGGSATVEGLGGPPSLTDEDLAQLIAGLARSRSPQGAI